MNLLDQISPEELQTVTYKQCVGYLDARMFGLCSYFKQGYLTVAAFSLFDMLRYFMDTDPLFLLSDDIKKLSNVVGIRLPARKEDINSWSKEYLSINSLKEQIELSYRKLNS